MKNKILIFFILILSLTDYARSQANNPSYEIVFYKNGFSYFNNKDHVSLTLCLNNNTDDTLYYRGKSCDNALFQLKQNPYFHLASDVCDTDTSIIMKLAPHRSKKMEIFLKTVKQPSSSVTLNITMDLYQWETNHPENKGKYKLHDQLHESVILNYNSKHQPFWDKSNYARYEETKKRILPDDKLYILTDNDRKLFTLEADMNKISKPKDTVVIPLKNPRLIKVKRVGIPVSINNNSNDTLRVITMSCSWFEFWGTNRQDIQVLSWVCEKNIPDVINIAPHQKFSQIIKVIYSPRLKEINNLKLSMSLLIEQIGAEWDSDPWENSHLNKIWTDDITI